MNLFDYEDVEPLQVDEKMPLQAPRNGEILGFVGPSNRDEKVIVCQERRYPYDGGKQNYFRKLGGYSFDKSAIETLKDEGVGTLVIEEMDNDRVMEFDLAQFINGEPAGKVDGHQQIGVPTDDALHTWTREEVSIDKASSRS